MRWIVMGALLVSAAPAMANTPLDQIGVWEGNWRVAVHTNATPYSHAGDAVYNAACAWQHNRGYMVCDYKSAGPDPSAGRVENNLSIFMYSDVDRAFKHVGMGPEGEPHEQTATVAGNMWTTPFTVAGQGKQLLYRNVYEFVTPEKRVSRFENSTDSGQHWTVVKQSHATKVL